MEQQQLGMDASGQQQRQQRRRPNILVTGTPGVGKTATASVIAEESGMRHFNIADIIQQHQCYDGRDEELESYYLDEDKLLDIMETMMETAAEEGNKEWSRSRKQRKKGRGKDGQRGNGY